MNGDWSIGNTLHDGATATGGQSPADREATGSVHPRPYRIPPQRLSNEQDGTTGVAPVIMPDPWAGGGGSNGEAALSPSGAPNLPGGIAVTPPLGRLRRLRFRRVGFRLGHGVDRRFAGGTEAVL